MRNECDFIEQITLKNLIIGYTIPTSAKGYSLILDPPLPRYNIYKEIKA